MRSARPMRNTSPPAFLTRILFFEPSLQGREIVEQSGGVHLPLSAEQVKRFRPGFARSQLQHRLQPFPGFSAPVDRAVVDWEASISEPAERPVELKLEDPSEEVAGVRQVGGDVILRARVESRLPAQNRRSRSLILPPHIPPRDAVVCQADLPPENSPS